MQEWESFQDEEFIMLCENYPIKNLEIIINIVMMLTKQISRAYLSDLVC